MKLWGPGQFRSCTNLRLIENVGLVACGQCDNCHKGRVKDWIGRCLLEAETAHHVTFGTLTYGGDRLDDAYAAGRDGFNREDVTKYLDRVRRVLIREWRSARKTKEGRKHYCSHHELMAFPSIQPKLRIFWSGELGSAKGRAHYHLLMFWMRCKGPSDLPVGRFCFHGKYPDEVVGHLHLQVINPGEVRWDRRPGSGMDWHKSDRTYWPFGMVRYEDFNPGHAWYVAGYVVKSQVASEVMRPGISRRPLLGAEHIVRMAQQHVDQMLSPQVKTYSLPLKYGNRVRPSKTTGRRHLEEYWFPESAVRLLCREFVARWAFAHARDPLTYAETYPASELLDDYVEQEEARRYEKENAGRLSVADEVREETKEQQKREATALHRKEPINLATVGWSDDPGYPVAQLFNQLRDVVPVDGDADDALLSNAALRKMAKASFSETAIWKRKAARRNRKLKSALKRRP